MLRLIHNELLKIIGRWRSYIGFIGIAILMPLILWGFSYGGGEIHDEYIKQFGDSFIVVGSIFNAFLATYIMMNAFWIHIPFLVALAAGDAVAAEGAAGTFLKHFYWDRHDEITYCNKKNGTNDRADTIIHHGREHETKRRNNTHYQNGQSK